MSDQHSIKMTRHIRWYDRRERIATALMQGIYSNPNFESVDNSLAAVWAVTGAEALIEELDREVTEGE